MKLSNKYGYHFYMNELIFNFNEKDIIRLKNLKSNRIKTAYFNNISVWKTEFPKLANLLTFYSKNIKYKKSFIDKYNVKKYHINLIKRLYISYDYYTENINIDYKKPYGNSNIINDIWYEYLKFENGHKNMLNIHNEVMNIFDKVIKELELESFEWIKENNYWEPTENGIFLYKKLKRKKKLERILK